MGSKLLLLAVVGVSVFSPGHCLLPLVNNLLTGLLAPMPAPLTVNATVNLPILSNLLNFLGLNGVNAVVLGDPSTDILTLSVNDMMAVMEETMASKPEGLSVIVQVGGKGMQDVLNLAINAEKLMVDAMLFMPDPIYAPSSQNPEREIANSMQQISEVAPNTPILFYYNPTLLCINLDLVRLVTLLNCTVPTFAGVVAPTDDLLKIKANVDIGGLGLLALDVDLNLLGAKANGLGVLSIVANLMPKTVSDLLNSVTSDLLGATGLQDLLSSVLSLLGLDGSGKPLLNVMANVKVGMGMVNGMDMGQPADPMPKVGKEKMTTMAKGLLGLGVKLNLDLLKLLGINVDADVNL